MDGIQPRGSYASRDRAARTLLSRTALAAINAGWTESEWTDQVTRRGALLQTALAADDRGRGREPLAVYELIARTWQRAAERAEQAPAWGPGENAPRAEALAAGVHEMLADARCRLGSNQRDVLAWAANEAARIGSTAVNCPRRAVGDALGISERSVRRALDRLAELGLLVLVDPGRASAVESNRRARVYRLPDVYTCAHYLCRKYRQMGAATAADPEREPDRRQMGAPTGRRQMGAPPSTPEPRRQMGAATDAEAPAPKRPQLAPEPPAALPAPTPAPAPAPAPAASKKPTAAERRAERYAAAQQLTPAEWARETQALMDEANALIRLALPALPEADQLHRPTPSTRDLAANEDTDRDADRA
jgi:Fe2+ or Zn2+ uptake regulation protein